MRHPYPKHLCADCRPKWVAWRDADFDPTAPTQPGGGPWMDERSYDINPLTGRLQPREWQEELQVQQMNLVAAQCAAHQKEAPMAGVFVLKHATTGEIHGVYASCSAADDARDELRTDDDPDLGDEYQIESWAISAGHLTDQENNR